MRSRSASAFSFDARNRTGFLGGLIPRQDARRKTKMRKQARINPCAPHDAGAHAEARGNLRDRQQPIGLRTVRRVHRRIVTEDQR
jgi:hypothetical protein